MKKVLIVNGAEPKSGVADGSFNEGLISVAMQALQPFAEVRTSRVMDGYDISEEQQKYLWADLIVLQFPVYWFSAPAALKRYIDDVYAHGVFFAGAERYGEGGLLKGRRYLLSTTWNAAEEAFHPEGGVLAGLAADQVLTSMHITQRYVGLTPLESFAAFNVINEPRFEYWAERWRRHLTSLYSSLTFELLNGRSPQNIGLNQADLSAST
ncbi:NAD(P)H-dependent oxidoreductase [Hahella aquimaris]|uniref:NAD(P)H-dependent oxidoreductase n=1 Tax=Hahella sp. HNIBRBA332 TaxID=3015983 RepID=UPI00273B9EF6|nr:NAD(P)H-dependent oxidoreductase [Hahella sp. HNIBRBA332]WLQ12126.1 NAD(P)H-dependent oxidoreductase [Hahella sp. HNIBRBA332]